MKNGYFKSLENMAFNDSVELAPCLEHLRFNQQGLIPVITQCHRSGLVLMHACMNKASIMKTLETGKMTYWSRSRNEYWEKGSTSGHSQMLVDMYFDCDGDSILCKVEQVGRACHTHRVSCFYLIAERDNDRVKCCL